MLRQNMARRMYRRSTPQSYVMGIIGKLPQIAKGHISKNSNRRDKGGHDSDMTGVYLNECLLLAAAAPDNLAHIAILDCEGRPRSAPGQCPASCWPFNFDHTHKRPLIITCQLSDDAHGVTSTQRFTLFGCQGCIPKATPPNISKRNVW